jgi:murein hydrolase activator
VRDDRRQARSPSPGTSHAPRAVSPTGTRCDARRNDRRRTRRAARYAALTIALSLALLAAQATADDLTGARNELSEITERLNELSRWFSSAERQQQRWQREIQGTDRRINEARAEMRRLTQQVRGIETELASLARERTSLEAQRDAQRARIAEHLNAAYRLSGQDFFKLLLNQQDPDELDRMMRYHGYFSDARRAAMAEFQATLAELDANERRSRDRQQTLARQAQALERTSRSLESERAERERLLTALATDAEHKAREQERLAADRTRLEQLITQLARRGQMPDGTAFARRRGELPWPVNGTLANRFGQERAGGRLKWHGIFIGAEAGTPVHAVHAGRVAFADWLRGFGLMIIVDHGDGHMSLYAHADALYKSVGDWVDAGEPVAAAGSSGGHERSGVYFEIRVKGSPNDPLNWLARR